MSDLLKVRIGGSDYLCKWDDGKYVPTEYVQIGSLLWTTKNLDLDLGTEGVDQLTHPWPDAGKLYTLDLILNTLVLSDGWRVPYNEDYQNLYSYVDSHGSTVDPYKKLSTINEAYNNYYESCTDEFGFNALITGYAFSDSTSINNLKVSANFWTQTPSGGDQYYDWCLENGYSFSRMNHSKYQLMLCIRLCKDAT